MMASMDKNVKLASFTKNIDSFIQFFSMLNTVQIRIKCRISFWFLAQGRGSLKVVYLLYQPSLEGQALFSF